MKQFYTYSLLLMFLLHCYGNAWGQVRPNGFQQSVTRITAQFTHEDLIIEPGSTFFNVLIIHNHGERTEEVFPDINVPLGWSVLASESASVRIQPGDSVLIPVRVAPAREVEGEIGYSVIATINNRAGESYTNAYCFIKVARQTDFQFRPITRMGYFDQQTGESELSIRLINRGNVSELVYLNFQSTRNIRIANERDNMFSSDIMLRPGQDTILRIRVLAQDDLLSQNGRLYRIDLIANISERRFETSFWFNHMGNFYKYSIPETEKLLITEITAQNLLTEQTPSLSASVRGNILFPERRSLNYFFFRHSSAAQGNFLRNNRFRVSYNTPVFNITAGDVSGLNLRYGGGKGAIFTYRALGKYSISATANRNTYRPITNMGISLDERFTSSRIRTQFAYSGNELLNNQAYVGNIAGTIRLNANHGFRSEIGLSKVDYRLTEETHNGFGLNLDYSGRINNMTIKAREQYGSIYFYGRQSGRHRLSIEITQPLKNDLDFNLFLFDFKFRPITETQSGVTAERYQDNREVNAYLRKRMPQGLSVYAGPVYQRKATNTFFLFDGVNPFVSHSAKLSLGFRTGNIDGLYFSAGTTFGQTFVSSFSIPDQANYRQNINTNKTDFFNGAVNLNLRSFYWGLFASYYYGPYSVNQELSKFYYDINSHSARLMPYLERFVYKDMIKLNTRLNYTYDFTFKTSRINLNNQLDIFLPNDFTASVINTFGYQRTTDLVTEVPYTYSSNYFEARLKKEFNWNQPRVKYYDININLFKDLNGNLRREPNEPGVKDIIVNITSIDPIRYNQYDVDYSAPEIMVSQRLLTGMDGIVRYDNLPRGLYKIELENIGRDTDKYFPDQNEFIINVADNKTVYVPYLERNKIFGRVILNRSRLSALGRIEAGNIKVTATDSKGRPTSTLTDNNGHFEMYVPSVDSYIVTVNNIFRDHFNLRQNDFRANLNGFKQFEVNFVFDEIRRQIEFTPSFTEVETEIRRVGRANLSGIVRDASTLQPIRATIEVVDNANGNTIAQTVSERNTGRYTATFVTGEDYMIVVSANGYWLNSERLILDQFLTIQDAQRDILLESIAIGARFQFSNLRFAPGISEIPTEAYPELDRLITQLRQNPNVRIRIEGHADSQETLNNPNISAQRAEAVMRYMVNNGFANIEFTGLRDSQPIAPSDTEENRRRNRRVEMIVVDR